MFSLVERRSSSLFQLKRFLCIFIVIFSISLFGLYVRCVSTSSEEPLDVSISVEDVDPTKSLIIESEKSDFITETLGKMGLAVDATQYHYVFKDRQHLHQQAPFVQRNYTEQSLGEEKFMAAMQLAETLHKEKFSSSLYNQMISLLTEAAIGYNYSDAFDKLVDYNLFGTFYGKPDIQLAFQYCDSWIRIDKAPKAHFYMAWIEEEGLIDYYINPRYDASQKQERIILHLLAAAEHDYHLAIMALGFKYLHGLNVEKDVATASLFYFNLAGDIVGRPEYHIYPGRQFPAFNLFDDPDPPLITPGRPPVLLPENLRYYELIGKSDSDNLVMLGQMYYFGSHGVEQSYEKALYYYETAAESGNLNALGLLGLMYLFGYGIDGGSDYEMAESLFNQCMATEMTPSPVCLTGAGLMELYGIGKKPNVINGLTNLIKAMYLGSIEAAFQLAKYNNSTSQFNFLRLDSFSHIKFMDQALKHGHVQALYETAKEKFKSGLGSVPEAVLNFKKISERAHGYLLHDAFLCFRERKHDESLLRYMIASFCGFSVGQENVAYILETHYKDPLKAFPFYNRAAIQDSARSRLKLGDYYYYGFNNIIPQDFMVAVENYRIAETAKDPQAAFNLGYMYEYSQGVQQDYYLAKRYYDRAREYEPMAYLPSILASAKVQFRIFWNTSWKEYLLAQLPDISSFQMPSLWPKSSHTPQPSSSRNNTKPRIRMTWTSYFKTILLNYKWAWGYFQKFIIFLFVFLSILYYVRALWVHFRERPLPDGRPNIPPENPNQDLPRNTQINQPNIQPINANKRQENDSPIVSIPESKSELHHSNHSSDPGRVDSSPSPISTFSEHSQKPPKQSSIHSSEFQLSPHENNQFLLPNQTSPSPLFPKPLSASYQKFIDEKKENNEESSINDTSSFNNK